MFNKGETVLCKHGNLIYKAKVLQCSKNRAGQDVYYVHYVDWNKNWDEWVNGDRILKYNEANLKRQKEAGEQYYATLTSGTKKRKQKGMKRSGNINASSKKEHGDVFGDDIPSTSRGCSNAKNESGLVNSEFEKDDLKYDAVTKLYDVGIEKEVPE
ncbi:nuA4 complex subunit EAF3 homolog [Teleopsis dalmanni]|uniref:nuA4 complex subunit EAF3 homolog n=1 Tax=Teleopsis dalmanni TaxID=139649 RepID=UPI0018CE327F|nr:nuA4 complex subunit EAF3 homolog [Teleopsis dalmanni]